MPSIVLPSEAEIDAALAKITVRIPVLGLLDTLSGQVFLASAMEVGGHDHSGLIEKCMGIDHYEDATHVRGFLLLKNNRRIEILNRSGLNPRKSRMEPELFAAVVAALTPVIRRMQME